MDAAVVERAQATVQRTGGSCASKVTLLPLLVNGWQTGPFCPPGYVGQSEDLAGCHRRLRMTLAEREELRRVGRENNATAGIVCPAHVKAAFNFEFDDINIDVPLAELLVEASKETPRWRVMLTPLPGAAGEPDTQSTPSRGDRII